MRYHKGFKFGDRIIWPPYGAERCTCPQAVKAYEEEKAAKAAEEAAKAAENAAETAAEATAEATAQTVETALPAAVPAGQSAAPANVTAPALGEPVSE